MQQTEKYWNLINRIVLVAIIVMAGVGVVLAFTPKVRQLQAYQATYDNLQHRIELTKADVNDLREKQRRFVSDPEFVERVAHEVGYAKPSETIFHFAEDTAEH